MILKAFIVEDEPLAREEIKYLLTVTKQIEVIGEAENMHEALWHIQKQQPDVVFLDIELAKGTGIELAKQFAHLKKQPMIVFATAYHQYALQAFELDAIDYLVKPIDENRLSKTVEKLIKHANTHHEQPLHKDKPNEEVKKLLVRNKDRMIVLNMDDIYYISTEDRQVFVKTKDKKYYTDKLLYQVKEKLSSDFLQVHRGYIINLKKVTEIESWFHGAYNLLLNDGSKVPVSRSYSKIVKQALGF